MNQQRAAGQSGGTASAPEGGEISLSTDFEEPQLDAAEDYRHITGDMDGWTVDVHLHQNLVSYGHQIVDLNHDDAGSASIGVSLPEADICTLRFFYGLNGYCATAAEFTVSLTSQGQELLPADSLAKSVTCAELDAIADPVKLQTAEIQFQPVQGVATLSFEGVALANTNIAWPSCGATIDEVSITCESASKELVLLVSDVNGNQSIAVAPAVEGFEPTVIYTAAPGEGLSALAVSPDGTYVAGISSSTLANGSIESKVFLARLRDDLGDVVSVLVPSYHDVDSVMVNSDLVRETIQGPLRWSADGEMIAFLAGHPDSQGSSVATLYVLGISGGFHRVFPGDAASHKLSQENYHPGRSLAWWPGWQYGDFALSALRPDKKSHGILVFRAGQQFDQPFGVSGKGSSPTSFWLLGGSSDCNLPEWSPDGSRLAWSCGPDVYVNIPDENYVSHYRTLPAAGDVRAIAWSPDLALLAYSDAADRLHLASSVTATPLSDVGNACVTLQFSALGDRLLCLDEGSHLWDAFTVEEFGGSHAGRIQEADWIPTDTNAIREHLASHYNLTLEGTWTAGEIRQIAMGARKAADAMNSGLTFQQVFPKIEVVRDPSHAPCMTVFSQGVVRIGCVDTARMTQYTFVHELGHAFDAFKGTTECAESCAGATSCSSIDDPGSCNSLYCYLQSCWHQSDPMIEDDLNQRVMGQGVRGKRGWGSTHLSWFDMPSIMQQNPCEEDTDTDCQGETSADLFLNWVYASPGLGFQDWSFLSEYDQCDGGSPDELWGCKDKSGPGQSRMLWTDKRIRKLLQP